jgi:hypothetical protein
MKAKYNFLPTPQCRVSWRLCARSDGEGEDVLKALQGHFIKHRIALGLHKGRPASGALRRSSRGIGGTFAHGGGKYAKPT